MVTVRVTTDIEVDLDQLAHVFAHLDDDQQAQFFCKVAAIADTTFEDGNPDWQWNKIGEHLRECKCSTANGRGMIRTIFESMSDA